MLQCLIRPLRTFARPFCMLVKWTAHISGRLINAKRHSHTSSTNKRVRVRQSDWAAAMSGAISELPCPRQALFGGLIRDAVSTASIHGAAYLGLGLHLEWKPQLGLGWRIGREAPQIQKDGEERGDERFISEYYHKFTDHQDISSASFACTLP